MWAPSSLASPGSLRDPSYFSGVYTPQSVNDILRLRHPGSTFADDTKSATVHAPTINLNVGGGTGSTAQPSLQTAQEGFSTLRTTKNPSLQAAIDAVLGKSASVSSDLGQNPFVIQANTKDQAQAGRIGEAGGQVAADNSANRTRLVDFVKNYMGGDATARSNADQEVAHIGSYYDAGPTGVQGTLDRMSREQYLADLAAGSRAAGMARAQTNQGRMQTGDSSYLDQQMMDTMARLRMEESSRKAERDRANLLGVMDSRTKLAGSRNALLDSYYNRALLPIDVTNKLHTDELGSAAALGNLTNANTVYNQEDPTSRLAKQLALLGETGNLDRANNFYGLSKPYEPDYSGYGGPRLRRPSVSPPGYDSPSLYDNGVGGGPSVSPAGSPRAKVRTPAEKLYYTATGQWPDTDQNFSPEAMAWAKQQTQGKWVNNPGSGTGWTDDIFSGGGEMYTPDRSLFIGDINQQDRYAA